MSSDQSKSDANPPNQTDQQGNDSLNSGARGGTVNETSADSSEAIPMDNVAAGGKDLPLVGLDTGRRE